MTNKHGIQHRMETDKTIVFYIGRRQIKQLWRIDKTIGDFIMPSKIIVNVDR